MRPFVPVRPETIFQSPRGTSWRRTLLFIVFVVLVMSLFLYVQGLNRAPTNFPIGEPIVVPEGSTIADVATALKERDVVRSALYLQHVLEHEYDEASVQAGTYNFSEPLSTNAVAEALAHGTFADPSLRLTIPEGLRGETMLPLIQSALPNIEVTADELDAHIGYLFPDTYHVTVDTTAAELIARMRDTFSDKVSAEYTLSENQHGLTAEEIVTLASIVEREANSERSKRLVAGILLQRLERGMPLQVDATFEYLLGKTSAELTEADLEIDSPFNTYTNIGLPPRPIANPGLESIMAVLEPERSEYLYYLTGNDGAFYYAEDFDQHVANKRRYLQ